MIITEDEAFTNVSEVDIKAAHSAAIMKPKTPGDVIRFATETNTSFGARSTGKAPGTVLVIAFPIHPALETTIAEIGSITVSYTHLTLPTKRIV